MTLDFMRTSKRATLNVQTDQTAIQVDCDLYPEGIAVFKFQGIYYAVEALTGYGVYRMSNIYNLMATMRDHDNREAILEIVNNLRLTKPAINKL